MRLNVGFVALAVAFALCLLPAGPGAAQSPVFLQVEPDADYRASVRFRNIQSEMFYVDRNMGDLDLDGLPDPPVDRSEELVRGDAPVSTRTRLSENIATIALIGLLATLGYLAYKYGGRARDGFARPDKGRRNNRRSAPIEEQRQIKRARTQELIARLLDMEDRHAAMVELIHHVLDAAATRHDLRLGRSETSRDFLRRLPEDWPYLADMRRIVIAEELVQFGGRPLITRTFEDCLRRATPILDEVQA
ncbi:DUF4129 domain-containing protein [Halovulum sp. GXIMD14793]